MGKKESRLFKRVDKPTDRKLRYEGVCPSCNKVRPFRYDWGSMTQDGYRCMKCGTIVVEDSEYEKLR